MNKTELRKKMKALENERLWRDIQSNALRARALSIGTLFGGTTEISMRGDGDTRLWCIMQPVEVVELIHQLAANIGCHIHIQPRKDFSSWRDWRVTEEEKNHLAGFPPFVSDMAPHNQVGANIPLPAQQPGLQPALMARSESNEQTVATQKTVGRKRTKRAAAAA